MAFLFLAVAFAGPAAAQELNWAQQLVRPIANTSVSHDETVGYGRHKFVSGPAENGALKAVTVLEGRTSAIFYKASDKNSPFEIFSVYKNYLRQNRFEIVFACEKAECGENFKGLWYDLNPFERLGDTTPITHASSANQYYIAAKKTIDGKDTYVSILVLIAGWWNIPIYRVDVAQAGGLDTEVAPAAPVAEAPKGAFFEGTHIYNNDMNDPNSTFAVLGYGAAPDLRQLKIDAKAEYLFVVINGQQAPCYDFCFGQEGDRVFGQGLTGIHRVEGENALNPHQPKLTYSIYNGRGAGTGSVAATLFDMYKDRAVIVDILNAKYDWLHLQPAKTATKNHIANDIIRKVVKTIEAATGKRPKIFITGFSRGGLLTYELSELLVDLDLVAAVSIDPVINPILESGLVYEKAYYNSKARTWQVGKKPLQPAVPAYSEFFPVLKLTNKKVAYYNVFQRKGLRLGDNDKEAMPIGSAVAGAKSPCSFGGSSCQPSPIDQYDQNIRNHTPDMLDTYAGWIIKVAQNHFPLPAATGSRNDGSIDGVPDFNLKLDASLAAQGQSQAGAEQAQAQAQADAQAAAQAQAAQAAAQAAAKPPPPVHLVPVPDVRKKIYLIGKQILESQGFKVNKTGNFIGLISAQTPAPNTTVERGSTVTLTVGK